MNMSDKDFSLQAIMGAGNEGHKKKAGIDASATKKAKAKQTRMGKEKENHQPATPAAAGRKQTRKQTAYGVFLAKHKATGISLPN